MKKKIYLIAYALFELVTCLVWGLFADSIAASQVESLTESFSAYPVEMQEMMTQLYTVDMMKSSVLITAVICGIIGVILLILFARNKVSEKKGLALGLTIASMILIGNTVFMILSIIAICLIAKTPKAEISKEEKEKREIKKLRPLKVDSKDIVLSVVLILLYSTQFFASSLITNAVAGIIFEVAFYLLTFAFAFYIFKNRLKRDFGAYKENVSGHVGFSFKWWGIMMLCSMVVGFIRMALSGSLVTANQDGLNNAPIWYIAPLAIIWAPFVEESIFRGCIRRFIKNDKVFIVVSALVFGLIHTIGSEVGLYNILVQSLQYATMGGVMAYVYTKTNNICTNMTIHCIQNTLATLLMFFM